MPSTGSSTAEKNGLVYYLSGQVAVMINRVDGGVYSYFYDDNAEHQLVANFNFCGIGYAFYPNGQARFITTKSGGMVCSESGNIIQEWDWENKGKMGPTSPVEFNLNSSMRLRCVSKTDILITMASANKSFQVGQPRSRSGTYLDNVTGRDLDGRLQLTLNRMSLKDRQASGKNQVQAELQKAQDMGWTLPRLSASGRETSSVCVRKELLPIMTDGDALTASLRSFQTEIGRNVLAHSTLLKEAPSRTRRRLESGAEMEARDDHGEEVSRRRGASAPTRWDDVKAEVPSAVIPKPRPPPPLPAVISDKRLAQLLAVAPRGQLVVVCCTTRNSSACKRAEQMCTRAQANWLLDLKRGSAKIVALKDLPPTTPGGEEERRVTSSSHSSQRLRNSSVTPSDGNTDSPSSPTPTLTAAAGRPEKHSYSEGGGNSWNEEDLGSGGKIGGADLGDDRDRALLAALPQRIVLIDCRRSVDLVRQLNISVYPMFLIYLERQLLHVSNTFNGFGTSLEDFLIQLNLSRADARRGNYLPAGFTLKSLRRSLAQPNKDVSSPPVSARDVIK